MGIEVLTIETKALGDRSYIITDGEVAAVIDPQRDIDRVMSIVTERNLRVTHVFETHLHNDYVTGGYQLSKETGADYILAAGEAVSFDFTPAEDGAEFDVGPFVMRAVHTPGHTPLHMSYIAIRNGQPFAAFTGGSMLYGTVGRTDLISAEAAESLTREQFRSVRRLADELPDEVDVHPTHGFGSFCSSTSSSGDETSTIGKERASNPALVTEDEERFVKQLLSGLTAYPRYYVHMAPINRQGPPPIDLSAPEEVDPVELRRRIHAGEWVVDLRERKAFASSHLTGTINIELGDQFSTYLGWLLPWGSPVTLVGDTKEEVAEAQRQLVRIGIDRPAGAATGGVERWAADAETRTYRLVKFGDLAAARERGDALVVLDVRRDDEWNDGHMNDAIHIPIHDLESRIDEVPTGAPVWVHCASGYRSSIAASILDRAGHDVVMVDDDWDNAPT